MFRFQIDGSENIINISGNISPYKAVYHPGDTVTITHFFRNNFTTHSAINMRSMAYLTIEARSHIYDGIAIDHGNVFPGAETINSFRYTFDENDVGNIVTAYTLSFYMMGKLYRYGRTSLEFIVEPNFDFDVGLSTDTTEIEVGDSVEFLVGIRNLGNSIDRFEVRNSEGELISSIDGMSTGGFDNYPINVNIYETADISYVVIAYID